jgi:hypothetical protein
MVQCPEEKEGEARVTTAGTRLWGWVVSNLRQSRELQEGHSKFIHFGKVNKRNYFRRLD